MWNRWREEFRIAAECTEVMGIKEKVFKPKFPELPVLANYRSKAPAAYWDLFPKNNTCPAVPGINRVAIQQIANTVGVSDIARLNRVIKRTVEGADIGCKGKFRDSSQSTNAANTYEHGPEVSDAVASWVQKKVVFGPVSKAEVPVEAKINGIMVRVKPDSSVRIILNLSAPKGASVNEGIDSEDFPAKMSSTEAWVKVLNKAGRGCWISKTDFKDAYKHVTVREEDTDLQWFEWAGGYFKELCLIFGSASSAGIFDDLAKLVLDLVCRSAKFPSDMICQHLDDICAAASADSTELHKFDEVFQKIAAHIGVQLAPRDDPEKSFAPAKKGTIFGVNYDTDEWTWSIPPNKLARILENIKKALSSDTMKEKEVKSLAGKLINIKPLVPTGKFNMNHIMHMLADSNKCEVVEVKPECKRQLHFWWLTLLACANRTAIPEATIRLPVWAIEAHCDAAGGTLEELGRGSGGVCGADWYYAPWSKGINSGTYKSEGKKIGRKLSALELVGALILVASLADKFRRQPVNIYIDNAGSVGIWKKGYSNQCKLCNTIVMAVSTVCAGLGCRLDIKKVSRCSSTGPLLADMLSKATFTEFRTLAREKMWHLNTEPAKIPVSLLEWLQCPVVDELLGHKILQELATQGNVLGYSSTVQNVFS